MMSRSLRAETRSRGKEDSKRPMQSLDKVRRWEKKWITIHDTTMKIYKWVPIADERKKKSGGSSSNKENRISSRDSSMSAFQMGGEDSNTAMSVMSDSQDGTTDFSCTHFNISEDSNSEPPFKKKITEGQI